MFNNNNLLRTENFWIIILWAAIFMTILVWDQEKIVVLNLIIFSYFMYYLVGVTINNTLNQRQQTLSTTLVADLTSQIHLLSTLLVEFKVALGIYRQLTMVMLKKLVIAVTHSVSTSTNFFNIYSFNSSLIQVVLGVYADQALLTHLTSNVFLTNQLLLETPPFSNSLDEESPTEPL